MFRCKFCNSTGFKKLFEISDKTALKCKQCGLVKIDGKFDISYDEYHRDDDYQFYAPYFKNIFLKKYKLISKYKKTGKVLDIGASNGVFLDIFSEHGWETYGVEPSANAKNAIKKGHKIYKSEFEKAKLKTSFFDMIIMNHTLEHVDNPVKFIKKAKRLLKKGGVLYIEVPNFGSLESKIFGKHWRFLLPDEHIYQFTPKTLSKLVKKTGLKIVDTKTFQNITGVEDPLFHYWFQLRSKKKHFYKSVVIDTLTLPFDLISIVLGKGTALAIIAKKQ